MFFGYNTANNEVIGFYNLSDRNRLVGVNNDIVAICNTRAADIMRDAIWSIDPSFTTDMWGTAEDVYHWYITRSNLYAN